MNMSQEEIDDLRQRLEKMMAEKKEPESKEPEEKEKEKLGLGIGSKEQAATSPNIPSKPSPTPGMPHTPSPKPADKDKPVLNLQDQFIPGRAWIPLPEEITQAERDRLVDELIKYINKMDFPPRFKDVPEALAYFGIMNTAQIIRINKLADDLKKQQTNVVVSAPSTTTVNVSV
jgi:hypothetical protein